MKSVPVGVKPPGRRRTGFRRFWVAVGKRSSLAVREKGRAQRHSDPERDGGHRDRGRCGHRKASCPAAARAHGAGCGSGWLHRGEDQASAGVASPPVARERGLWAGVGLWPGARREVRRSGRLPPPPTPPPRLSFAQSLAPRSGCLRRRRGQMKGVGAAGPPQPPTRWRRRCRILGDTAPRALPPPGPCAPRPCAQRPHGALNGAARTGSLVPAAVGWPGLRAHT